MLMSSQVILVHIFNYKMCAFNNFALIDAQINCITPTTRYSPKPFWELNIMKNQWSNILDVDVCHYTHSSESSEC